ncbi:MAG: hypothetical protein ACE362_10695 [Phaeodactylibacter xiamenensis]|nr:hypothetical protein [Phaeodactylibacter xiamenensis]MCR9053196.1 hypothetical protein [bacterium]
MRTTFQMMWGIMLLSMLAACAKAPQQEGSSLSDDWSAMMAVHDEVMPKMSNIARLKKQLKGDTTARSMVLELTKAEDAMWEWMHNLRHESDVMKMPEPKAKAYVAKELQRIEAVKALMLKSIAEAEAYQPSTIVQ